MSVFGQNKPAYLKTYGKQKRKLEQWFSPDLRKKAFSFSSTPSSDQSIPELTTKKRKTNNKKSTASGCSRTLRMAKQKAMEALKDMESDEESIFILGTDNYRRKPSTKLNKKTALPSRSGSTSGLKSSEEKQTRHSQRMKRKGLPLSNSENESDSFATKNISSNAFRHRTSNLKPIKQRESVGLPHVGRFVTQRRRGQRMQSEKHTHKQNRGISSNTLNMSKDFFCDIPGSPPETHSKQSTAQQESDAKPAVVLHSNAHRRSSTVLREISLNDVEERMISYQRPLLCSTPSLVTKRALQCLEPSISEISSFSCDESDKPPPLKENTANELTSKALRLSTLVAKRTPKMRTGKQIEKHSENTIAQSKLRLEEDGNSSVESARPYLNKLKKRAVMMLKELDVSDTLSSKNGKQKEEKTFSPRLEALRSRHAKQTCHTSSDYAKSDATTQDLYLSSFVSVSSHSGPPVDEVSSSLQAQIDRLKVECLSSCVTVCLQRLNLSTICQASRETLETRKAQVASSPSLESRRATNFNLPCIKDTKSAEQSSISELQTEGLVGQMSASLMLSAISPAPGKAPNKMPETEVTNGLCSSRKVCVKGLNSSRWSKKSVDPNRKQRQNEKRTKHGDFSSSDLLSTGADSYMGESVWLQSSKVMELPKTPLRSELLNLSTFLTNFTPDSLTTYTWGRLKAALSIHKKKTAFPTPRRLALSNLKHGLVDTSLELFGTPLSNRVNSHLLKSSINNTSMISFNEDISDAEKVYQECQQEGPLSFDDCIPPECMKHCIKIGEGTFGEVFSVVNDTNQTVALKIIPIEGHQKVNGEPQKTFGEVLHEIIISKELSALNSKEHNKTNGFIGLINLHCVRGCYPSALLNAWDKFDQGKGSENDRPDFFGQEQLFLILEFEFGGSDLENMNGKLTSLVQAKSVLHQVTAALAVAEESLCFEHRDLHWGNILVKNIKEKHNQFILNDSVHSIETRGVHVNIIDYSLSRLEIDGLTVSCDIANEEELFMGQGDYQFEIYRLMKKENNNCWVDYHPHSNVLWLHYLSDKLLTMKYKNKAQTSQQKALKSSLKSFHSEVLNFRTAKDVLLHSAFFQ
ncbi:Serine/threonine-protein kinase haspin [Bagarius yarrelli]|uniref:Serine/threonine-protein kinase haspin n=1 Tax=Bagarius yarrelli TaxID=175774 RepID=A0A556UGG7_BAGYA|nr:Serine/threonine-protein kinase haspin [Bagarius yarrelli]